MVKIDKIVENNVTIAIVSGEEIIIKDVQSALDLIMTVYYETDTNKIVIDKNIISEDFFKLSTCLAGDILQKFINYQIKAAIYGDFTKYTSKSLKDFIYESNQGNDFFFTATQTEAINKIKSLTI